MDNWIIAPLYLNYERFVKENHWNFSQEEVFRGIKILFLRNSRTLNSVYHLPSIRMQMKYHLKQSITEGIEKLLGINSQGILKITELNVYTSNDEQIKKKQIAPLEIVFLKSDEVNTRTHISSISTEFVSLLEISKIKISEHSNEYVYHVMKWVEKDCITRSGLQKWFNTAFNKDIAMIGRENVAGYLNKEIKQKSTSLDTISNKISRQQLANIESNKKQADSLDQLSQSYDKKPVPNAAELKIAMKNKISKTKSNTAVGPVAAIPLNESSDENFVIKNPLINGSIKYQWESDVVIQNNFWNKVIPDLNQINKKAQSLFSKYNLVRTRSWSIDYPLHFASYKGDVLQVAPLIDKGYNCTHKDYFGWTPLHYAVWYGHRDIVAIFVESNSVSVNTRTTTDLMTPLHIAIYRGYDDITSFLLKQPDIDLTLTTINKEDARFLAERLRQQYTITLLKSIIQKTTKLPVYLMDNSVKHLILTKGMDTTFQSLKIQMIEALNVPNNCVDVFNFWIGYKSPKITGKYSVVPLQCFGDLTMTLKEINVDDMKLHWKRNIYLSLETERRVKDLTVISLLFEESVQNFTAKSLYPCDSKDIILLCSVLLYLYLPQGSVKSSKSSRRTLSLSRIQRPLSFMFNSNPDVSTSHLSSSLHTLTLPNFKMSEDKTLDKSIIVETRKQLAKQFLSNEKNLSQITPKKKMRNCKINFPEDIFNQFFSSSFAYKSYSIQDVKFRFLTLCWNLTLYGCAYFYVDIKLQPSIPFIGCIIAVNDMGVYFMHSKTKTLIQNFKYSSISWNNCADTKCLIFVTKKNNIYIKSKFNKMISQLMLNLYAMNPD